MRPRLNAIAAHKLAAAFADVLMDGLNPAEMVEKLSRLQQQWQAEDVSPRAIEVPRAASSCFVLHLGYYFGAQFVGVSGQRLFPDDIATLLKFVETHHKRWAHWYTGDTLFDALRNRSALMHIIEDACHTFFSDDEVRYFNHLMQREDHVERLRAMWVTAKLIRPDDGPEPVSGRGGQSVLDQTAPGRRRGAAGEERIGGPTPEPIDAP